MFIQNVNILRYRHTGFSQWHIFVLKFSRTAITSQLHHTNLKENVLGIFIYSHHQYQGKKWLH